MIKVDFEHHGSRLTLHTAGDRARLHVRSAFASAPESGHQHLTPKQAHELGSALLAWSDHQQQLSRAKAGRRNARKAVKADPGKAGLAMAALMHPNARVVQPTR